MDVCLSPTFANHRESFCSQSNINLTLTVLVTTINALGHFETG